MQCDRMLNISDINLRLVGSLKLNSINIQLAVADDSVVSKGEVMTKIKRSGYLGNG